jgi:hypothetical protein
MSLTASDLLGMTGQGVVAVDCYICALFSKGGYQMQSEIKIGQRFKFNTLSDNPSPERLAVVTRVLSNSEEGLGTEVGFYLAYWVEARELPETEAPTTLEFQRGIDGNVYLNGRQVSITLVS